MKAGEILINLINRFARTYMREIAILVLFSLILFILLNKLSV